MAERYTETEAAMVSGAMEVSSATSTLVEATMMVNQILRMAMLSGKPDQQSVEMALAMIRSKTDALEIHAGQFLKAIEAYHEERRNRGFGGI